MNIFFPWKTVTTSNYRAECQDTDKISNLSNHGIFHFSRINLVPFNKIL